MALDSKEPLTALDSSGGDLDFSVRGTPSQGLRGEDEGGALICGGSDWDRS